MIFRLKATATGINKYFRLKTCNKTSRNNLTSYFFGTQFITTVMGDVPSASSGVV
jgi:hypothetical protein